MSPVVSYIAAQLIVINHRVEIMGLTKNGTSHVAIFKVISDARMFWVL